MVLRTQLRMPPGCSMCFTQPSSLGGNGEQQASVIVRYESTLPDATPIAPLIKLLRQGKADRWLLRKLQRYSVTVRQATVTLWQARGDVEELLPGLYLLTDDPRYDARLGMLPEGQWLDAAGLVA